jgi:dTDP-4-dehydrorhamnose reductase
MKIVLLGANGQLARDLRPRLRGEVISLTRADLDLADLPAIAPKLAELQPDCVVNCAAYNLVDLAETEPDAAFRTNAWGVRELARVCGERNARLVHVSTDYVFGLDRHLRRPLTEDDPTGPVSVYGTSKLNGEFFVRTLCPRHLVLRTCGLYGVWGSGGKGGNFVETMLRVAGQGKPLKVVHDQFCSPTYTGDLAEAIVALMDTDANGLFHLTSSGQTTWHDLAAEIFRQSGIAADLTPITSEQFGAKAARPPYSVLNCDKAARFGVKLRPWPLALAAYLEERKQRRPA